MDIDLGGAVKANVKIGEQSYQMRLPTVLEAEAFQEKMKDEDKQLRLFVSLVVKLGLPEEVATKLDVHQFQILSEGLLGMAEKK